MVIMFIPGILFTSLTEVEAFNLLKSDLKEFETIINKYSYNYGYAWDQNQYDAFVSLAYNSESHFQGVMDDIANGIDPYYAFGKIIRSAGKKSLGYIGDEWMRPICFGMVHIIEHTEIGRCFT